MPRAIGAFFCILCKVDSGLCPTLDQQESGWRSKKRNFP
ncbi:hypothetical protein C4K14_5768 [Pseudomonas chlororaphis subsp. aureofaciens]|nr:hypothetical protein C4K14_5768 [Pseudomonas chlororaphis subsp. aureofaciens]